MNMNEGQAKESAKNLDEVRKFDVSRTIGRDLVISLQTLNQNGISQQSGKTCLECLQRPCGAFGVLPASFTLTDGLDLESRPFTSSGFVDVYKATYNGLPVVVKAFKTTSMDDLENVHEVSDPSSGQIGELAHALSQRLAKEVVGWKGLRHENILPFVGVTLTPSTFSVVSAWMENGNIMSFIKVTPDQNPFTLVGISCPAPDLADTTHSSWM